ncbi:calcyclin-binding protein-like [Lytechinus pictus]|uniref:calcyclin-binding protein-like n=1 Tax=Lytechinus pictus TaxID=7653 RepID=UPI0030B9B063
MASELELDCQELERLSTLTTRDSVRTLLSKQIQALREPVEASKLPDGQDHKEADPVGAGTEEVGQGQQGAVSNDDKPVASSTGMTASDIPKPSESQKVLVSKLPSKTITSYGWDQSPKFVKVYVTLNGVQSLAKDDITVIYTSSSMSLRVKKSDCIHQLVVNSLLHQIIPDKSHHKVKTDNLVILLKKRDEKNWAYLTETEKKAKQKGKPTPPKTDTSDPSAGIVDLMKQMYDDGDDDMKRTIAQAWTQAREKKDTMELP